MKSTHSQRLERWLGAERVEQISRSTRGWYGKPIHLVDVPGSVRVCGDGDFIGPFDRGYSVSAIEALWNAYKRACRSPRAQLNAGFASIDDALSRASQGFKQYPGGQISKIGTTGAVASCNSLWQVGPSPVAGIVPAAAPGGLAPVDSTQGGMLFANPAAGTSRLVGANFNAGVINNALLLYDRTFHVAKTMNSTATEAVTGVPTRYQSATATAEDYAGNNFLTIEVGLTLLAATAHNWTVCLYTNQAGTGGQTLPTVTGVSAAAIHRIDKTNPEFFCPLASGDVGIKALTQMQCSALVATGTINFAIGHPIGFMAFPSANFMVPFDWLTNMDQAPRVFDDACLALMEMAKPATTATTYTGQIVLTSTSS